MIDRRKLLSNLGLGALALFATAAAVKVSPAFADDDGGDGGSDGGGDGGNDGGSDSHDSGGSSGSDNSGGSDDSGSDDSNDGPDDNGNDGPDDDANDDSTSGTTTVKSSSGNGSDDKCDAGTNCSK